MAMTGPEQTPEELKKSLGARIRLARRQAGLTQKELGIEIGVSSVAISDWERGVTQPTAILLWQVGNTVGQPTAFFLKDLAPEREYSGEDAEESFLRLYMELDPTFRRLTVSFMQWAKQEQQGSS